jgi:hypothetical protein
MYRCWGLCMLGCSYWIFKLGVQVCAFKFGCSRGRRVNSWFPLIDGVSLPTTSR